MPANLNRLINYLIHLRSFMTHCQPANYVSSVDCQVTRSRRTHLTAQRIKGGKSGRCNTAPSADLDLSVSIPVTSSHIRPSMP